jgi:hypothetical protein
MIQSVRFQGNFRFSTRGLTSPQDQEALRGLGRYTQDPAEKVGGFTKVPNAVLECAPADDEKVSSYLIQKGIAFQYQPTAKPRLQMHQ